ncbi:DUF4345 domain-containing protein [Seonamhaeicola sp. MEBiC1930]|uniref:DUF4345 domain-containing protein n=1 Tax=Seonamhaeicola sp. MEBiC01930 TaxID=2976768 RepID=UPI0032478F19
MEILKIIVLSLSSLLLIFVGISRLTHPIKTYFKNSGIKIENDTNLLNEIRGISSVMLCGGIITCLGIFHKNLTFTSLIVAALIFLGFAIGRIISLSVDGKPNRQIVQGVLFEIIFGLACVIFLIIN